MVTAALTDLLISLPLLVIGIALLLMYFLMRKTVHLYFQSQQHSIQSGSGDQHKLMINAYERLVLLCERIQPDKLAIRLQSPQLSAQALSQAMIVAIHQEFEHNITQQIYISENLWNILCLTKDEVIFDIIQTSAELPPDTESRTLTQKLLEKKQESPLNQALKAIRKEAHQYVKI